MVIHTKHRQAGALLRQPHHADSVVAERLPEAQPGQDCAKDHGERSQEGGEHDEPGQEPSRGAFTAQQRELQRVIGRCVSRDPGDGGPRATAKIGGVHELHGISPRTLAGVRTPASVLAEILRSDPARPRVTFYEDTPGPTQGERIELSGKTVANWISKAGNALQDEYDLGPGSVVRIALPVAPLLAAEFVKLGTGLERKRSLIFNLLDSLHYRYQKGRLDRRARRDTALNLALFGFIVLLLTAVGFALLFATRNLEELGKYHVLAVMWAGLIGAYFSRIIAFQRAQSVIDNDELVKHYSWPITAVRLVIGAMGALMMYFLIKGNLVGGAFFPQILADNLIVTVYSDCVEKLGDAGGISGPGTGPVTSPPIRCTPETATIKVQLISTEMAQLLVWSLVAGFSERLIPERLSNLAAGAANSGPTNATSAGATDLALIGRTPATTPEPDPAADAGSAAEAGEGTGSKAAKEPNKGN